MTTLDVMQIILFIIPLVAITAPLGLWMAKILAGEPTWITSVIGWLEKLTYACAGLDPKEEMSWKTYLKALLVFNAFGFVAVFILQMIQAFLPLNPQHLTAPSWHLAFNTAMSFMTNTNWQAYAGETTLSYFTQMVGLTVQNFLSAATGIGVFLALTRGLVRKQMTTIGNFWVDLTRSVVYILLPLSIVFAFILVGQGVVQNLSPYRDVKTLEGATQTVPMGPAASQIAIKQLGTNGGGFFNANSAHPFENPTPLSNWLELLAILALPAALTFTYGRMVKSQREGWTLFGVMFVVFLAMLACALAAEYAHNPVFAQSGLMEGKETRFGITTSVLWSTITTLASNGSVNAMHASLSPLAGGIAMFNMMLGEVIFGGVGAGLYGMLLFVLLTVFLSGLMVGRSPEYLGKKIEAAEIKWAIVGILAPCAAILIGAAIAAVTPLALASLQNRGPHGFSELLYAFTSAGANNGSAFAGLNANTVFMNIALGVVMLIGRFSVVISALAIAGSLVTKKVAPPSAGTFETHTPIFGLLLVGVIIIVGALTFLPALTLGPIIEHFLVLQGRVF